jgi:hypothetical protein
MNIELELSDARNGRSGQAWSACARLGPPGAQSAGQVSR